MLKLRHGIRNLKSAWSNSSVWIVREFASGNQTKFHTDLGIAAWPLPKFQAQDLRIVWKLPTLTVSHVKKFPILWPSKQKLGIGPLLRFQLPIHIHPNKKSRIVVYFSFLGNLVLRSNSIPKGSIHTTSKQSRKRICCTLHCIN
jgi:hypothetical protein